jgi:hypothetical protein
MLNNDNDLDHYAKEIEDNFISGRYATYSAEGAMLGYLLSGDIGQVLKNVAQKIRKRLTPHPNFVDRAHRISKHERQGVDGRKKESFYCHHLAIAVY